MATVTAQIIAGGEDLYHGGIRPIHVAWLSQNSRPGWHLEPTANYLRGRRGAEEAGEQYLPSGATEPVLWVPSHPDHILEEGILLIALRAVGQQELVEEARRRVPELLQDERAELEGVDTKDLETLRALCAETELDCKLVVSLLSDSSLDVEPLERYRVRVEVLSPGYSRSWGGWSDATVEEPHEMGSLAACSRSVPGLLARYRQILSELREQGVIRSANAPAGDYAEWLVSRATRGELAPPSEKSWDVLTPEGEKLQVKCRFVSEPETRGQRQLSVFRSWDFDALVVVLFDDGFGVRRAARLPTALVRERARPIERMNAERVHATEELLDGGEDWTERLREAAATAG